MLEVSSTKCINGSGIKAESFSDAIKSISGGPEDIVTNDTNKHSNDVSKSINNKSIKDNNKSIKDNNKSIKDNNKSIKDLSNHFDILIDAIDNDNRNRITTYLEEMSKFYDLENVLLRANAIEPSRHLVCLIRYGRVKEAIDYVRGIKDSKYKKQCLYILARNSIYYEGKEEEYILSNSHIKTAYRR